MPKKVVLFSGRDASGASGLWATDGTAAGTYEVEEGSGVDIAALDGQALFSANGGLWVTDGTPSGTQEIASAAEGPGGFPLDPTALTAADGEVFFLGGASSDASPSYGLGPPVYLEIDYLWSSDGTAAGTRVVSWQAVPSDIVGFKGEALCAVTLWDAGLWVTDGTFAGTNEITGISGADAQGVSPTNLTVFGNAVLFNGIDTAGYDGLWTTDGTGAGTYEITGISGVDSTGFDPTGFTVLGGEALFAGLDAAGHDDLWVTDGTATGTREVAGVVGESSNGLDPTNLAAFNNEVLFNGVDASGEKSLWVTDGTAAGTHEITGVSGADADGLDPTSFAVLNDEALFSGLDASGENGLWATDGTAAGTHEITGVGGADAAGLDPSDLTAVTLDVSAPVASLVAPSDFNGDGKADLLLLNANDTLAQWQMNGAQVIGGGDLDGVSPNLSPGWSVAATGDFNGDGKQDLLLLNGASLAEWLMNGTQVIGGGYIDGVSPNLSAGWSVAGVGDFNGDGKADLLLQNGTTLAEWLMNGTQVIGGGYIDGVSPNLSAGWSVAGIGDFNGDGKADLLLQDVNTDGGTSVAEWLMNGAEVAGGGVIGSLPTGWSIAGVGDFNGDGKADLLLQHTTNGAVDTVAEWLMNGAQVIGGGDIDGASPNFGGGWALDGVGDFNGDGKSDLLLKNTNGAIAEWLMNGANVTGGGAIGTIGAPWSVL